MKTTAPTRRHGRFTDKKRIGMLAAQAASGQSIQAFCARRKIHPVTFYGWKKRLQATPAVPSPAFAQVEVTPTPQAMVEVLLPNGVRVGIRQEGRQQELIALIRGVAGYGEARPC